VIYILISEVTGYFIPLTRGSIGAPATISGEGGGVSIIYYLPRLWEDEDLMAGINQTEDGLNE